MDWHKILVLSFFSLSGLYALAVLIGSLLEREWLIAILCGAWLCICVVSFDGIYNRPKGWSAPSDYEPEYYCDKMGCRYE